jgi:hypothetical protein
VRFPGGTRRQAIHLSDGAYRRLVVCASGVGKGPFAEVALNLVSRQQTPLTPNHRPTKTTHAYVVSEWGEFPSILSSRLETLLTGLHHIAPFNGAETSEKFFELPHSAVLKHVDIALREGKFPQEALGESFGLALRTVIQRLEPIGASPESITAAVPQADFARAVTLCHKTGLDFNSVVASEVMEQMRRKL